MRKHQPIYGNGGSPRGRRITDDTPDAFGKSKDFVGMTGKLASGERVSRGTKLPKHAKRKDFIGMTGTLENGEKVSQGKNGFGKSRFYDPESRRQRRLGMYEAALAGGAAAGLGLGGKGIVRTSRLARKMPGVVSESNKDATALRAALRHGVAARRKDVGLAAGGTASGIGAFALNRHAESRRGRPMN